MNSAAATTIRQRLEALRPQVLEVARRYGASNLRIYGSIATGQEHSASDLDLLVDLPKGQSLLGLISLRQEFIEKHQRQIGRIGALDHRPAV